MAFDRNLMMLAAAILAIGIYGVARGAMTLNWPRAHATITSAALVRQTSTSRGMDGCSTEDGWNSFHVLCQYRVGDRDYLASGVGPYDFGMRNSAGAARMRERHPIGSQAEGAHDPEDPAVASSSRDRARLGSCCRESAPSCCWRAGGCAKRPRKASAP